MKKRNGKIAMYEWQQGEIVLGYGITDNLESRREEHEREAPGSRLEIKGNADSEREARHWGREQIKTYEATHGDFPPKNKPR